MAPCSVVETDLFIRQADGILTQEERDALISWLALNPTAGVVIPGSGGLRKLRVGALGRGKRGGARTIYWFHSAMYPVVLLAIYAKSSQADLSAKQAHQLARLAEGLIDDFGG